MDHPAAETDNDEGDKKLQTTDNDYPEWCLEDMICLSLRLLLLLLLLLIHSVTITNSIGL